MFRIRIISIVVICILTSSNIWAKPKAVISNSGPICLGSTITLSETGGDAVLWTWSSNGSATFNNPNSQNPIASGVRDGEIFKVVITDIHGEKDSATMAVKVNIIPVAPMVTVVDNCDGTSTLSTVSPGVLLWSTGMTTPSITVATPGTYTVTSTIAACTSQPGSGSAIPKTRPATPVVTVVDNCDGTSILSTVSTGALLWSTAKTTSSITVTSTGPYTVTSTINGCTSLPGSGTATPKTIPATPIVTVVNNCDGTSTLSTLSAGTLLWSTAQITPSITVTASGTYTVTTTINGCTSLPGSGTASPKTIPATPVVTVVNNCDGTSTLSTVSAGTLLWSTAQTTPTITVTAPGIYTVTSTTNGCTSLPGSGTSAPKAILTAPVVASTLQPTCTVSTGTIELNGLPSGTWTINPGSLNGSTTTKTISGLSSGTYSFTVTNSSGCTSPGSSAVIINTQPVIPVPPTTGVINQPSCSLATGSVQLNGLIETGIWTLTRYPGTVVLTGSGKSTTISGLPAGTYNFTLANSAGCVSTPSANVIINVQPPSPSSPVQITDCSLGYGKAQVKVTSPLGAGLLYSIDGGAYTSNTTFDNQVNGTHVITVKNQSECTTIGNPFSVTCGCSNPPIVTLSSSTGSTCGISPVTISNNLFSGSASKVNITTNGKGTISPVTASVSPFSFTYTPSISDAGKKVTISFTTDNPNGFPCVAGSVTFSLTVNSKPSAPVVGVITQMTCKEPTGSVALSGMPPAGAWILTANPGPIVVTGTGISAVMTGLAAGVYSLSVSNVEGCTSSASSNVIINSNPGSPLSPTIGTITAPTCNLPTGSVVLNGLPQTGSWTLTRTPDHITSTGSGTSITIAGINAGTYNYSLTNSAGCISEPSKDIVIVAQPAPVTLRITNPPSICSPGMADLTNPVITSGSTLGITFAYYTDASAIISYTTPSTAGNGIYYIKGTSSQGCYDIKPVRVTIIKAPEADAGPDKILDNQFETIMEAVIHQLNDTGIWSVISGTGEFLDKNNATTSVSGLSINKNVFKWVVSNGNCPASSDTVIITVGDLKIQTLITPNMDGRNDYFEVKGLESMGRSELLIFNRGGVEVFKNLNYDNLWNGVDNYGKPLQADTYFYSLRSENGKTANGFIVIRR